MECPICYDPIGTGADKCSVILSCSHQYCMECLHKSTMNSNQCPMCRCELYKMEDEEEEAFASDDEEDDEDYSETSETSDEEDADENVDVERVERNDFELDAQQQFNSYTEEQINNIPELYLETVYEKLVERGITMMDLLVLNYSGLTSKSDKYNTVRKRRNLDVIINNIVNELDNELMEGYAMGLEDVRA
jgi:hypothetical protein